MHILDILIQYSDKDNLLSIDDIIRYLSMREISTERKSVSRDLKYLAEFLDKYNFNGSSLSGMFSFHHKIRKGYFIDRKFKIAEIKVLIDGILSNKSISKNETTNVIKKLKGLVSHSRVKDLENQIFIDHRIKSSNPDVIESVETIHKAIIDNKKVSFQYVKYELDKVTHLQRDGFGYVVSPYALTWDNNFYYLIGNYKSYSNLSHYRIDRITNIEILEEERIVDFRDITEFNNYFDTAKYMNKIFSMYPGEEADVEIIFPNSYIDLVIETFGLDVTIIKLNDEYFKIRTRVELGEGFVTWCVQFGDDVEVVNPLEARNVIKEHIEKMYRLYK